MTNPVALALSPDRRRPIALTGAGIAAAVLFTQVVLPGSAGGRGTPAAILFFGFINGLLISLAAAGIVLVYRTTRVINFAQLAIGAAGATFCFQLVQFTKVPFLLAIALGLAVAGVVGVAFDLIIGRRFLRAPRLTLMVATIVTADLLGKVFPVLVAALPIFPKNRTLEQLIGSVSLRSRLPFAGLRFGVGSLNARFGFAELFAIEVTVVLLVALAVFLRASRWGVAIRAMASNADRAALLGISVGALSTVVWATAGVLSGAGVILTGVLTNPATATGSAPTVLVPALAAAVLGRMRSIPWTVTAAVLMSVLSSATLWSYKQHSGLVTVAQFLVIGIGLFAQRRTARRSEEGAGVALDTIAEQAPVPRELQAVPGVRWARRGLLGLGLVAVVLFPYLVGTGPLVLGQTIALQAIIAISIVVLTGWAGQVSLGQIAFAAIGAVVAGGLSARAGVPFWIAIPLASLVAAAVAMLIGLPALRIPGLFLAVATFAFAVAVRAVLFEPRYFDWLLPSSIDRPRLFLLNFEGERPMYYLCIAALFGAIAVTLNVRRTRLGRALIAVRENEANLQSLGIGLLRTKLTAFALAGGLAGFAGALSAFQQRGVSAGSFLPEAGVAVFLMAMIGGVTSVGGALLGAAYATSTTYFFTDNPVLAFLRPYAFILILYIEPGGLLALFNRLRDGVLRIVAQRRHLVVPSLFADYDPELLARRLTPLGEPVPGVGLVALPPSERYTKQSHVHAHWNDEQDDGTGRAPREPQFAVGASLVDGELDLDVERAR